MLECLIELLYNRLSSFRTSASRVAEYSAQRSDMSAQPFGSSEAVTMEATILTQVSFLRCSAAIPIAPSEHRGRQS